MKYEQLFIKYPKLFSRLKYIECNEGWIDIIDLLCTQIEIINSKYPDPEQGIFASQVKQKYGGLRFYISSDGVFTEHQRYVDKLILDAESISYKTCESCGAPAAKVRTSRYSTLCDECNTTTSVK